MKKYTLTVGFDHDTERPDEYSLGRMVSFYNRHNNFTHPDTYLEMDCPDCDGYGTVPLSVDTICPKCEEAGVVECAIGEHPDVLAILSYYEHGLCKWMVGPSIVPDYGGFDTAQVAGVIVWNGEDSEREWWDNEPEKHRKEILEGIAETYTSWANGECFWYSLAANEKCPTCHNVTSDTELDGCGGHIGSTWASDAISDMVHGFDINPDDIEITGEAADYITIRKEA